MDKLSELKEKSELEKIRCDYSNGYGFDTGLNSFKNMNFKDKMDKFVKGQINMKKR